MGYWGRYYFTILVTSFVLNFDVKDDKADFTIKFTFEYLKYTYMYTILDLFLNNGKQYNVENITFT